MNRRFLILSAVATLLVTRVPEVGAVSPPGTLMSSLQSQVSDQEVELQWNEDPEAFSYRLLDSKGKVLQSGKGPNFTVSGLEADGLYGYYLQSMDEEGSPIETVAVAAFVTAVDQEFTGFKTVMATPNVVKLDWHEMS